MRQAANPFGNIPHALDFFRSASHGKVLQRITSGLQGRSGLLLLTGEIGSGKTTVCKYIQHQFRDNYIFSDVSNPFLSREELLHQLCTDMGARCRPGKSVKQYVDLLEKTLAEHYADHKTCVLFLDESHLLTKPHFRLLLVLSNLKRDNVPLLQIVMVGQYELLALLEQPGLEAMNQRIGTRCRLAPLSKQDTAAYIVYKLERARFVHKDIFDGRALRRVFRLTGGLPRLINHVCAHAMNQAVLDGKGRVNADMVEQVFTDPMYTTLLSARTRPPFPWKAALLGAVACLMLVGGTWGAWRAVMLQMDLQPETAAPSTPRTDTVRLSADPPPNRAATERSTPPQGISPRPQGSSDAVDAAAAPPPAPHWPEAARDTKDTAPQPVPPLSGTENTEPENSASPVQPGESILDSPPAALTQERGTTPTADGQETQGEYDDLPDARSIPALAELHIDGLAWSPVPARRMVVINGTIRHEGDSTGKAVITHIGKSLIVLSHEGMLYTLNVKKQ